MWDDWIMLKSSHGSRWSASDERPGPRGWYVTSDLRGRLLQSLREGPRDREVLRRLHVPVAAQHEDHRARAVPPADEAREVAGGGGVGEDLRPGLVLPAVPLVAPGGEEGDGEPELRRAVHDPVDVREVRLVRPARVVLHERPLAVGVRGSQAVVLREGDGLDHGEALGRAVAQVEVGLLARQAVEERPRRVGEVEEGTAVRPDEVAAVRRDAQGVAAAAGAAPATRPVPGEPAAARPRTASSSGPSRCAARRRAPHETRPTVAGDDPRRIRRASTRPAALGVTDARYGTLAPSRTKTGRTSSGAAYPFSQRPPSTGFFVR